MFCALLLNFVYVFVLGAVCSSSGTTIVSVQAMPGYWPEINGQNEFFVKCINDACLGGSFGACTNV